MSRWREQERECQIDVGRAAIPELVKALRAQGLNEVAKELDDAVERYGSRSVEIDVGDWDSTALEAILPILKFERKAHVLVKELLHTRANPHGVVRKLQLLPKAIQEYLAENVIDGWIYEEVSTGVFIAFLVTDVYYGVDRQSGRPIPYVRLELKANRMEFRGEDREDDGRYETGYTWYDVGKNMTAADLLREVGYIKETSELKAEYLANEKLFEQYQPKANEQFRVKTYAVEVQASRWSRQETRYTFPHPRKMVNDEGIVHRKTKLSASRERWISRGLKLDANNPNSKNAFTLLPLHPFVLMFDLTAHENCWVHVGNMAPYVYDPTLRDKLVLPDNHRDLIDVLTQDMDVFQDDLIEGKSGGTAILCHGKPGLGKTLTAEVYSEVVKRPLYRVHAGQLGTDVDSVEKGLETILRRSERWGAVLLLDEADVYIRRRGDDIRHNAVVAAFLRTLEYFHGLLFMTTNRVGDVDDAIASRMVALFKYETPDIKQRAAMWRILSTNAEMPLPKELRSQLVTEFEEASGRDIKQLLTLVKKYCRQKDVPMSIDVFRKCAMFRGVL